MLTFNAPHEFSRPCLSTRQASNSRTHTVVAKARANQPSVPSVARASGTPSFASDVSPGVALRTAVRDANGRESVDTVQGVEVDERGACDLDELDLLIRKGRWKQAVRSFNGAVESGQEIPPAHCISLIQGLCRDGLPVIAYKVFSDLPSETRGSIDYKTHHFLIRGALKDGAIHEAMQVFSKLKSAGYTPNQVTACSIISGLLKHRRRGLPNKQLAYNTWKDLERVRTEALDAASFRAGCNACVSLGKMAEAESLILKMRHCGYQADNRMYNMVIKGYSGVRNMTKAMSVFKQMKLQRVEPDRVTYNTLLHGFVMIGDVVRARGMLEKAQRAGIKPDVRSYTSLMKKSARGRDVEETEAIVQEMREAGVVPDLPMYGTLIDAYVRLGDMTSAESTCKRMREDKVPMNSVIYNTLLKGYANLPFPEAHIDKMVRLLSEMSLEGIIPQTDTYNIILKQVLSMNDLKSAHRIFREMAKSGVRPDGVSYTLLMKGLRLQGGPEACEKVFEEMRDAPGVGLDMIAWNCIVACYALGSDMDKAEEAAEKAVNFAQSRGFAVPVEVFGALIDGYAKQRNVGAAISVFRHFYQLGGQPDVDMFESLLKLCLKEGETQYAYKVLRAMDFSGIDIKSEKYHKWMTYYENRFKGRPQKHEMENDNTERLKFWLGLPNRLYSSDWP